MIIFRPKFEESDHEHPEFSLVLSKKQNYDIVSVLKYDDVLALIVFILDVGEGWRTSPTRFHKVAIHNDTPDKWHTEVCSQTLTESKHSGDHLAHICKPSVDGYSLREAGCQYR